MHSWPEFSTETLLLTPNRRLSVAFSKQHQKLQTGKIFWETPHILPLQSWLEKLWRELLAVEMENHPFLLSSEQELALWEMILKNSPKSEGLLQVSRTAELAKSAWGILQQWQIDINHSSFQATEDTLVFQQWAQEFSNICLEKNWITSHGLIPFILHKIATGKIQLPRNIIVAGFTELSPQQKTLFAICEQQGTQINYYNRTHQPDSIARIAITDNESEIYTMARWAKSLLAQHVSEPVTIGCVIPNLEDRRDQVIRIFSEVFDAENSYSLSYINLPFNISAGKSLASYPIIHTALQLLNLASKKLSTSVLSNLLRSPFLGEAESEKLRRAAYDVQLISENITTTSLNDLLTQEKLHLPSYCPALGKRFKNYHQKIDRQGKKPVREWIPVFLESLNILGWPGERRLNSTEFQTVKNCWLPLLDKFATFDAILSSQTYKDALHYLTRLAANTVFQPQSPEAPIQILGMLEAAEIPFDDLWIMGLDDTAWPPAAKPNPFLPSYLQKTLNTPNANAERELNYCKKLMHQLKNSGNSIIFSHALQNEKAELHPSTLIKDIPETNVLSLADFTSLSARIFKTQKIEHYEDNIAPPVQNKENIRGGVNIFKQQAACPFKAYAEIRLHAVKPDAATLGLRPQDRGSIVHKVLELIWQELQDSDTLKSYSEDTLKKLIERSVKEALSKINNNQKRYFSLEKNRLQKLLWNWLQLEKSRPFFKVLFREEEHQATIGNINVKLRVDRIDELDNGQRLIIDYKTGKNNQIKNWFDERLEEPQLPIYCIINPQNTIGISFSEVHPDALKNKGISKSDLQISGIKPINEIKYTTASSWEEQLQSWQSILEKIANDFCEGEASVNPKDLVETCKHCHLKSLCRIYETPQYDE